MGASRETANLWYWFFQEGKYYPGFKRSFRKLISNPYFWNDSFGKYIYRYLICKLLGHRNLQWIDDCNSTQNKHCFSCGLNIESRYCAVPPFKDDNQKPYAGN